MISMEHRAQIYGVFQWGKGVCSGPLLNVFTHKISVFEIACGNYHTIISTEHGIQGWGENGSGQLGHNDGPNNIHKIKMVPQMVIKSSDQISLCCGN